MKYYIHERLDSSDKTAMLKARVDVEDILFKNGYAEVVVDTVFGVRKQKILKPLQLVSYWNNQRKWLKLIKKFTSNDIVFIQCPLINAVTDFSKVIKALKAKNIHLIGIIHDLETLRYEKGSIPDYLYNRLYKAEQLSLKQFDNVIVHNNAMKKRLIELGFDKEKLVVLEIFDYIYEGEIKERKLTNLVSVAGNLSKTKAGYLRKISNISEVLFNLYGIGISEDEIPKNARYNGSFSPEELISRISGSFGLVWDGDSTSTCSGGFGKYLIINNPHKVSMLIAAKMPIIIWKKAALTEFVKKNDIGWAISNLDELTNLIKNISEKEYSRKLKNIEKISERVRSGHYLTKALEKCEVKK